MNCKQIALSYGMIMLTIEFIGGYNINTRTGQCYYIVGATNTITTSIDIVHFEDCFNSSVEYFTSFLSYFPIEVSIKPNFFIATFKQ